MAGRTTARVIDDIHNIRQCGRGILCQCGNFCICHFRTPYAADGDNDEDGLTLGETDGETEELGDTDGLTELDGEVEPLGLVDALGDADGPELDPMTPISHLLRLPS